MESVGVHLSGVLEINAGVHSNADAVKEDDLKQFTVDQLAKSGAKAGQGIFVLTGRGSAPNASGTRRRQADV